MLVYCIGVVEFLHNRRVRVDGAIQMGVFSLNWDAMDKKSDSRIEEELYRQLEGLRFGTAEVVAEGEFVEMLRQSIATGQPLRVKCGIDPTSSDVHLGHAIPYGKMRQFQDFGHTGVVVIGDYTASIGDPSGRDESRKALDFAQVRDNTASYMEQISAIVGRKTEIRYQSEWFEGIGLRDVISWAAGTTVAKLLGHESFKKRIDENRPLSLHELLYPVLQGIDSVYVKADVELGGTDQRFNVLMGRDYQRERGERPQSAMLLPLLTGTCGHRKMSKSLGNTIRILDEPFDKFGKVMSIPDDLLIEYSTHFGAMDAASLAALDRKLQSGELHPNEAKKRLACRVVELFHGGATAKEMRRRFESVFREKGVPEDVPEFRWTDDIQVDDLLLSVGLVPSKKEARRLVVQGAVGVVDGERVADEHFVFTRSSRGSVVKVGKRKFVRLV